MLITLEKLKELDTCDEGIVWFKGKYQSKKVELIVLIDDLKAEDKQNWAFWLLTELMKDRVVPAKFAVFCAGLVLHLFEQEYPGNAIPRNNIEATQAWIENPTDKTKKDISVDTSAVTYAVTSATDAGHAAYAAWMTVYSAYADSAAAAWASYAAKNVSEDFHKEVVDKIIAYGLKLIGEQKC